MKVIESSSIGEEVLREHGAIILGISINNSYFKSGNLEELIRWASEHTKAIYLMIPDLPSVHTLVALGGEEKNARRTARLKANSLENKCKSIITKLELQDVQIIRWEFLKGNQSYQEALLEILKFYYTNVLFHDAIFETTMEVLRNGMRGEVKSEAVDRGVLFLLEELAFITRANYIITENKVGYVYHRTMPLIRDLFAGKYEFKPCSHAGFITVV